MDHFRWKNMVLELMEISITIKIQEYFWTNNIIEVNMLFSSCNIGFDICYTVNVIVRTSQKT